jgi:hypothetical protein
MIRELRRPEGCPSDYAFDRHIAGELGGEETSALKEHAGGCERCRRRLVELSREKEAFGREAPPLVMPRTRAPLRWLWGGGGILAAAAANVLFVRLGGDTTRTKGGGATLGFYVSHAGGVRLGAAGERLEPGDALRFIATTHEPKYLAIYSVDGARHISVYFPSGTQAALIESGERAPLPESTVLDDTLGDETIYGVFCEKPFEVESLRRALSVRPERPPPAPEGCDVDAVRVRKEAPALQ